MIRYGTRGLNRSRTPGIYWRYNFHVFSTGLKFKSFKSDACVTMVTATGKPYIDKVNDNFGVAIGGNGHAAMSCDAIGRLAARMMLNSLDEKDKRVLERCKLVTEKRTPSCKL